MKPVRIIDPNSEIQREVEGLRVTSHKEFDKHGKKQTNEYVEFTVIGKNRKWQNFMPLNDFRKYNPKVKLK